MKLPIKKRYFDMIGKGTKDMEYREAHITFICESTGRKMRREIEEVDIVDLKDIDKKFHHLFREKKIIRFWLNKKTIKNLRIT